MSIGAPPPKPPRVFTPPAQLDVPRSRVRGVRMADARKLHLEANRVLLGYIKALDTKPHLSSEDLDMLRGVIVETGNLIVSASATGAELGKGPPAGESGDEPEDD